MKTLVYLSLVVLLVVFNSCKKKDIVPVDSFIGNYHMVGSRQFWSMGDTTHYPPTLIDDTMIVSRVGLFTVNVFGRYLDFTTYYGVDSLNYYNYFAWNGSSSSYHLSFHRPFTDDSAFYSSSAGGLGGGNIISLQGTKIH